MNNSTAGPWSIEKERDGIHFVVSRKPKGVAMRIARICGSSAISSLKPKDQIPEVKTVIANEKLICAAPDLFVALELIASEPMSETPEQYVLFVRRMALEALRVADEEWRFSDARKKRH